ncbi:MAG: RnfABCDGE type electron transport complex subunit B [Christensenellaceae bacterium]|nr:RnfABCDGE type electron transport complex subunit B [Christensenellaceae bacterium]
MDTMTIVWSLVILGGLGVALGLGLGIASKKLAVEVDERIEKVREYLPGANCGACGFPGCDGLASAIVENGAAPSNCGVCSAENLAKIGQIMGQEVQAGEKMVARVRCQGDKNNCADKARYAGLMDCKAAAMVAGGFKKCHFACLGLGTCAKVCPFGAIKVDKRGVAEIDEEICTGCGKCAQECPVGGIVLMPKSVTTYVACRNEDFGKAVAAVCSVGCIGCKLCAKVCPESAITMEGNLPVIDTAKCTGCGLCAQKCKPGAIVCLSLNEQQEA